ncbi:hypothetical protein [Rhizobium sp. FKY42]|uniref:hypothetical protein n=1 Tax=Rhizobium sp. FKY42 TaxID=2562310 RepID=UPI0010BF938E|nr:hypothetical protein [Rhizobium sp. FKY42]
MSAHLRKRSSDPPADNDPLAPGKIMAGSTPEHLSDRNTSEPDTQMFPVSSLKGLRPLQHFPPDEAEETAEPDMPLLRRVLDLRAGSMSEMPLKAEVTVSSISSIEQQKRLTAISSLLLFFDRLLDFSRMKMIRTKHQEVLSSAEGRPLNADIYPVRPLAYRRKCKRPDGCVLKTGDTSFCDRCITPDL